MLVTAIFPVVIVPVLSKMMVFTALEALRSAWYPLKKMPSRAP